MPRSKEQLEQLRKEKKNLIMDVALELFAKNGFHATSISEISQKAGISKGLIYTYFTSKQEILKEITDAAIGKIYKNFDLNKDGILTKEEFIFFIRESFRIVKENLIFWQLYTALILQPGVIDSFGKEYKKYDGKAQPLVQQILDFLKLNDSEDPQGDLMVISSMLKGAFVYAITTPEFFPLDVLEEKIIHACLRLIK
ncbi:MAG: TetR/AcrR family transcriptional regulator [Mangrovibacterium sp.]